MHKLLTVRNLWIVLLGLFLVTSSHLIAPGPLSAQAVQTDQDRTVAESPGRRYKRLMWQQRPLVEAAAVLRDVIDEGAYEGYAGIVIEDGAVALWWKGDLPVSIYEAVADTNLIAPIEIREAKYSLAELRAAAAQIRTRLGPGSLIHSIKDPGDGSRLILAAPLEALSPRTEAIIAQSMPNVGVDYEVVYEQPLQPISRNDDSPPWRGGAVIINRTIGAGCTSSIPGYQYPVRAVKHLSPVKAAGSFQAPVITIFRDDFETDRGWIPNPGATDTAARAWRRDVSRPASAGGLSPQTANANIGNNALLMGWFGGTSARSDDDDGGVSSILSPEITLPSAGTLTLSFNSYFARSGKSSGKDFLRASIVNSDVATPALTVSGDDTAVSGAWVLQSISLNQFAGQTIRILFETADGAGGGAVKAAIDDVAVTSSENNDLIEPLVITNVALNKPATGSAPCNANEGPAKAFNGSVSGGNSDKWCSTAAPRFLQVDLGANFNVTCFRLSHAGAGGESADWNTRDFNIQTSVDGTNFVTAVNVSGNIQNVTNHSIAGRQARFIRLNVTTPTQNGNAAARIYEFEVFGAGRGLPAPPETIQEHWFEHNLLVRLVRFNDDAAIYFDDDVDRAQADWILDFVTRTWRYYKQTYGPFGPDPRGYSIHHQGRFFGGHPGDYFSPLHDFLNSSDIGVSSWVESGGNHDIISHEFMHVVESANNNVHGSPAFGVWGDSKWAEFAQYDLYIALGMQQDADRVFNLFTNARANFPRPNTAWFRDWFFPLWRDHGRAQAMVRFFGLLAQHFPKTTQDHGNGPHAHYTRGMNLGEFIHFMSGAAGTNLSSMATTAFGAGTGNWEAQFQQARIAFPAITY